MSLTRRPIALAAAAATALTLGATSLAMTAASAAERPLEDYTLTWGVKQSFRDYLGRAFPQGADATVTAADGATQAEGNGAFTFTGGTGTYDSENHAVQLAFEGSVRIVSAPVPKGHGFEIELSDIRFDSSARTVTADVTRDGSLTEDVPLAEFTPSRSLQDMPTTLTKEAAEQLGGPYEGEAGDPLTVTAPAAPPEKPEPSPGQSSDSPAPSPSRTSPQPTRTASRTPDGTSEAKVVDGRLTWGVKESFRGYIEAGGRVTVAGGAKKTDGGYEFAYRSAEFDAGAEKLGADFGGSVRFAYEAHGINMTFSDVKVRTNGAEGTLLVDVKTPKGTSDDVAFARLDLSKATYKVRDDVLLLDRIPATFTAAGAEAFANDEVGSIYRQGQPIDPVTLALSLDKKATLPDGGNAGASTGGAGGSTGASGGASTTGGSVGGGSAGGGSVGGGGNLAATGSDVPTGPLLGAAAAAVAAGAGVVFAARRRRSEEAQQNPRA
ncbi:HtaA domain-containing protein [Streptomyces sp. KLOTTS4A1]|uniref:HtaA domain-containing protein n=1 Tax=Streptomyces sp. KLOTTS4A1 TaxID=3390996 RepID=UPI0039F5222B